MRNEKERKDKRKTYDERKKKLAKMRKDEETREKRKNDEER